MTSPIPSAQLAKAAHEALDQQVAQDPLAAMQAVRRFVYRNVLFAGQGAGAVNTRLASEATSLQSALQIVEEENSGLWCLGTSVVLSWIYNDLGYETYVIAWGENSTLAHAQVLVKVRDKWYMQDGYFNYDYVDQAGRPLPYQEALKQFASGKPPVIRQDQDERLGEFRDIKNAAAYVPAIHQSAIDCVGQRPAVRCDVTMTLSRFGDSWVKRAETEQALLDHQLDADRLDSMSVFQKFASRTQPGRPHVEVDQELVRSLVRATGCSVTASDKLVCEEDSSRRRAAPKRTGWMPLRADWISLVPELLRQGPAPLDFQTPAVPYNYGASTRVITARGERVVRVNALVRRGKVGFSLMTPEADRILGKEIVVQPSSAAAAVDLELPDGAARYVIVARNANDPGVAGELSIVSTMVRDAPIQSAEAASAGSH